MGPGTSNTRKPGECLQSQWIQLAGAATSGFFACIKARGAGVVMLRQAQRTFSAPGHWWKVRRLTCGKQKKKAIGRRQTWTVQDIAPNRLNTQAPALKTLSCPEGGRSM